MRVGLVLGAGGVVGASWLIGALEALQDETGWEPVEAEAIVGTSAGAVVGALTATGMPPAYMSAYVAGHEVDEIAQAAARAGEGRDRIDEALAMARSAEQGGSRPDGSGYRLARGLPPIGPPPRRAARARAALPADRPGRVAARPAHARPAPAPLARRDAGRLAATRLRPNRSDQRADRG